MCSLFAQGGDAQSAESKEKQAQAQQDAKNSILSQILDQSARARCMYAFILQ